MAFTPLQPAGYVKKQAMFASFSVRQKTGLGTLFISVPTVVAGKGWDKVETCSYAVGDGEHAGMLRIAADAEGGFKVGRLKNALVFRVPAHPGWAPVEFRNAVVKLHVTEPSAWVIYLPEALLRPAPVAAAPAAKDEAFPVAVTKQGKPRDLSVVGTTVSRGEKTVRLAALYYKAFSLLNRDWGRAVSPATLLDDLDIKQDEFLAFIRILRDKLAPLGLVIIQRPAEGFVLQLSPEA